MRCGVLRGVAALERVDAALRQGRSRPDAHRTSAPPRRGTPTPSCSRSSTARRGRRRRAPPRRAPTPSSSSARAISSVSSGRGTPTICRDGARRVGERSEQVERRAHAEVAPRLCRVPHRGMKRRREEERDADLVQAALDDRRRRRDLTPSASSTSALPHRLDTERLPCLATRTPQAATTSAAAVEMLNVPERSPPVPQVSNTLAGGVDSGTASARIVRAKPDELGGPLAFHRQADQQPGDLRRRRVAAHDHGHRLRRPRRSSGLRGGRAFRSAR